MDGSRYVCLIGVRQDADYIITGYTAGVPGPKETKKQRVRQDTGLRVADIRKCINSGLNKHIIIFIIKVNTFMM